MFRSPKKFLIGKRQGGKEGDDEIKLLDSSDRASMLLGQYWPIHYLPSFCSRFHSVTNIANETKEGVSSLYTMFNHIIAVILSIIVNALVRIKTRKKREKSTLVHESKRFRIN